jgi:hypothetical protein
LLVQTLAALVTDRPIWEGTRCLRSWIGRVAWVGVGWGAAIASAAVVHAAAAPIAARSATTAAATATTAAQEGTDAAHRISVLNTRYPIRRLFEKNVLAGVRVSATCNEAAGEKQR